MEDILKLVSSYITDKNKDKVWRPGIDQINYAGTYFTDEEYVAAVKSILGGWLGLGEDGLRFERRFPRLFNRKYGVLTNSGSSANLLMYSALMSKRTFGFPRGTKVLTPVAGFPTTINPIFQLGLEPVFVDIELNTLNLNLDHVEYELKNDPDIKIISFAHVLGNPPNMPILMDLIAKYKLVLLEDCCDALGSTYDDLPLGSFGEMSSCSFYPAHHMTMGEGGFVTSKNEELNKVVKSLRDWGRGCYCQGAKANQLQCGTCGVRFNKWLPELEDFTFDHKYVYDEIGFNLKPIEMQASIGLIQMSKLPDIHAKRRHNYKRLFDIYSKYSDIFIIPIAQKNSDPSWFAFPLTIQPNHALSREKFVKYLESKKIQTRPYFAGNVLLQPGYSNIKYNGNKKNDFPNATYVTLQTFFHGTSPVITDEQMDYIGVTVDEYFDKGKHNES